MLLFLSRIRSFFFFTLLLYPLLSLSQESTAGFPFHNIQHFTPAEGLNGSEVYWMIQDKRGFLWFITDNGLNRYDGYSFRSYSYKPGDTNSLSPDWNWGLAEDREGLLWVPTNYQGVFSFDAVHEKFKNYHYRADNRNSVLRGIENCITTQRDGSVWISTQEGLCRLNPRTGSFTRFLHSDRDSSSINGDLIVGLFFDNENSLPGNENDLWIVHYATGIELFNTQTGKVIKRFHYRPAGMDFTWGAKIRTPGIVHGVLWLGSDDRSIYGFNIEKGNFFEIPIHHPCTAATHLGGLYGILEDHKGNLWTSNDNNEIVCYSPSKKQFYFYSVEKWNINFFQIPPLICEDRSHKIWFTTNNGLVSLDNEYKKIVVCQHDDHQPGSVSGNSIYLIGRSRQGALYVGATTLDVFDRGRNNFSHPGFSEKGEKQNTFGIWTMYEDSRSRIWFTGFPGLARYDPLRNEWHPMNLPGDSGNLNTGACVGALEDKKGRFWTANWDNGLFLFDPETGKTKVFGINSPVRTVRSEGMATLFLDSKGILYTCSWHGGFTRFDPDKKKFEILHHDPGDPSSLSQETAHVFFEDKKGLIWFCSFGGGINVFNPATQKFRSFTTKDGLIHDVTVSLVEDKKGNYWVGTRGGLSCFRPPADPFLPGCKISFRNYDISDGLPSNVLNQLSAFCDTDGTLFFGTRNAGLFYFHPDSLADNSFIPPVYITGFTLRNKPVSLDDRGTKEGILESGIEFTDKIQLNYRQNTLSFTFAALNYIRPEKNRYAYMLEGYDPDWIYTDASKRYASYTNLPPGKYVFKVRGSNNDGKWNKKGQAIKIVIAPPFWKTAWFKVLVGLFLAFLVYAFYRYRVGQIILLHRIRNKIAADLHDDIGSTLNSISVYSEVAKKDETRKEFALKMIGESSRKIIDSLSDIVWSINPENDNFDKVIFRMRSLTYNLLKAKKIDCSFRADESLNDLKLPMQTRRNFYLIFKETLNNLVKYSQADRASVTLTHENRQVILVVHDNGIGFDSTAKYNGNGLNNIRKRAGEINARLNIESATGTGTTIELNLKV